uniref:Uncharacterized protein n=1 Tax=Hyaloperonospora arabidopsidis (strain Emoy2) TaxID=559515 RepID=M4C2V2_HYAAE
MVTDRSQQRHLTQRIVKKGVAARAGIGMIFVSDSTTLGSKREAQTVYYSYLSLIRCLVVWYVSSTVTQSCLPI